MNTIQAQWSDFESKVISAEAGEIQRMEMERAFFAGAHAALNLIMIVAGDETLSEKAQQQIIDGMLEETAQYGRDVGAGRR